VAELARLEPGRWGVCWCATCEHGYSETAVALLMMTPRCFGTGQLPKFAEDSSNH